MLSVLPRCYLGASHRHMAIHTETRGARVINIFGQYFLSESAQAECVCIYLQPSFFFPTLACESYLNVRPFSISISITHCVAASQSTEKLKFAHKTSCQRFFWTSNESNIFCSNIEFLSCNSHRKTNDNYRHLSTWTMLCPSHDFFSI